MGSSRVDEGRYLGALPGGAGSADEMVNHKVMERVSIMGQM